MTRKEAGTPDRRDLAAHPELLRGLLHTDAPCPDCGAPLTIDTNARRFEPGASVGTRVTVAACSGCEFIVELKK